jgi:putative SOS response-associated peptidase YedK
MCGRFNIIDDPSLRMLLASLGVAVELPATAMVNIAPTENVPVVVGSRDVREMRPMRWWLTPSWSPGPSTRYSMFNAKSETITSSRAFRGPFRRQRAVVPVSSFIEWNGTGDGKQAWLIEAQQGALALGAIWDHWEREGQVLESCCLITTAAVTDFEPWHHRMPVMLRAEDYDSWLDPSAPIQDLDRYFKPRLPGPLRLSRLGKAVNNARNKQLELLQPLAPGQLIGA